MPEVAQPGEGNRAAVLWAWSQQDFILHGLGQNSAEREGRQRWATGWAKAGGLGGVESRETGPVGRRGIWGNGEGVGSKVEEASL